MGQPAAAPLDHFCILFLREKDVPARHERRTGCRRSQTALWFQSQLSRVCRDSGFS